MSETATVYEKAITTERSAEKLAKRHGFDSLAQLAESLPPAAWIMDVGAGLSPFGSEVARLRPDITWINFDYSYKDPDILDEATSGAPANVEHIAGDATKLSDVYEAESFDGIFSYWLLPHLSLEGSIPAEQTAEAMFNLTKPGGFISVGPSPRKSAPLPEVGKSIKVIKDGSLTREEYVKLIVQQTKLSNSSAYLQKLINEVATPFFGTTRYARREGRVPKVYHPETGEYVSPFTSKGVKTAGRLTLALARHAHQQHKNK